MRIRHLILAALLVFAMSPASYAGDLVVKGSTTILPIMQAGIEAFMAENPDVNVSVSGGGSSNGIKALLDGSTDIAMASRKIKDKEINAAKEKGMDVKETVLALDAIIPIVNKANGVENLTKAQLRDIYTGKVTNWKEVGGADEEIVVISRDTSSGTYGTWKDFIMTHKVDGEKVKERVTPKALLLASSGAVLTAVAKNPKAIAYDGLGYVDDTVKALKVDGAAGGMDTTYDGSYPLSRELQVYTNGEPGGDAKKLVDFLLSDKGQNIVGQEGFIPLKK